MSKVTWIFVCLVGISWAIVRAEVENLIENILEENSDEFYVVGGELKV